ncbi:MAG: ParA family protein [Elusimicrobiota bacterium]
MSKIIAIANQKGGVGKTTTAINLSASLAILSNETLLIDMDPQANATSGFGIKKEEIVSSIYNVLIDEQLLENVILPTEIEWCEIVPSGLDLVGAEVELVNMLARETRLKNALAKFDKVYDYIIVDCPPSLGLLTVNALVAAHSVIIPIQCEYYALEGLGQLLKLIDALKKTLNPNLYVEGVLLTMYDARVNLSGQVIEEIKKYFGDKVYKTIIPRNVRVAESPGFGKPVVLYDKNSRGAEAYLNLAKEMAGNRNEKENNSDGDSLLEVK